MQDVCHNCFLFLVAVSGGFIGVMLMNACVAVLLLVCTKMEQEAKRRNRG